MLARGRRAAREKLKNISKGDNIRGRAHERRAIINDTDVVIGKSLGCFRKQREGFAKG